MSMQWVLLVVAALRATNSRAQETCCSTNADCLALVDEGQMVSEHVLLQCQQMVRQRTGSDRWVMLVSWTLKRGIYHTTIYSYAATVWLFAMTDGRRFWREIQLRAGCCVLQVSEHICFTFHTNELFFEIMPVCLSTVHGKGKNGFL